MLYLGIWDVEDVPGKGFVPWAAKSVDIVACPKYNRRRDHRCSARLLADFMQSGRELKSQGANFPVGNRNQRQWFHPVPRQE